jgi:hypothetical protein
MRRNDPAGPFVIFVIMLVVAGLIGYGGCALNREYNERQEQIRLEKEKVKQAKEMVEECRSCPEEGLAEALHRADPWGNDLMVKYNDGFMKSMTIISCGPDGKPNTKDDITATRHVKLDWKKAGEGIGEAGGDLGQGLWRGLKRSFTSEEEKDKK